MKRKKGRQKNNNNKKKRQQQIGQMIGDAIIICWINRRLFSTHAQKFSNCGLKTTATLRRALFVGYVMQQQVSTCMAPCSHWRVHSMDRSITATHLQTEPAADSRLKRDTHHTHVYMKNTNLIEEKISSDKTILFHFIYVCMILNQ